MTPLPESSPLKPVRESHSRQETTSVPGPVQSPPDRPGKLSIGYSLWFWSHVRRIAVFLIGTTIVIFGVIMLVIPGPGLLTIAGGLALLATEFAWARWALKNSHERLRQLMEHVYPSATQPENGPASRADPETGKAHAGKAQASKAQGGEVD